MEVAAANVARSLEGYQNRPAARLGGFFLSAFRRPQRSETKGLNSRMIEPDKMPGFGQKWPDNVLKEIKSLVDRLLSV
jgi:hypothetical protein